MSACYGKANVNIRDPDEAFVSQSRHEPTGVHTPGWVGGGWEVATKREQPRHRLKIADATGGRPSSTLPRETPSDRAHFRPQISTSRTEELNNAASFSHRLAYRDLGPGR